MLKQKGTGVIVGRFQTPYLHDAHCQLIEDVSSRHKRVLIFLGSTPGILSTKKDPLDFFTRKLMIEEKYPSVTVLPIQDQPSDEKWSKTLDSKIAETLGDREVKVILYGSRDSFIPHYHGVHETRELDSHHTISATEVRDITSEEVRSTEDFRRGVVYSAFNRHPVFYTVVDIVCTKIQDGKKYYLVGRKNTDPDNRYRFPGGFLDPKRDTSFLSAAKREFMEEASGIDVSNWQFIGSILVDDWRYKGQVDKMISAVHTCVYNYGHVSAGDDLDEVRWIHENEVENVLIPNHQEIFRLCH